MIYFFVYGRPSPGGSKRYVGHSKAGRAILIDMGGTHTKDWRAAVAQAGRLAMGACKPYERPLRLKVVFHMKRPKAHFNKLGLREYAPTWHSSSPDATKLLRSTEDALKSIVWTDDRFVVVQHVEKRYCDCTSYEDQASGAWITVEEIK